MQSDNWILSVRKSVCVCGGVRVLVCGGGIRIMCQISLFDISMSKYLHKYEQEYEHEDV